jgi:hypothetical protein
MTCVESLFISPDKALSIILLLKAGQILSANKNPPYFGMI